MDKDKDKNVEVMVKCKRGTDPSTSGQYCDSLSAYNLSRSPGSGTVQFKCAKCGYVWTIPLGGAFVFPT